MKLLVTNFEKSEESLAVLSWSAFFIKLCWSLIGLSFPTLCSGVVGLASLEEGFDVSVLQNNLGSASTIFGAIAVMWVLVLEDRKVTADALRVGLALITFMLLMASSVFGWQSDHPGEVCPTIYVVFGIGSMIVSSLFVAATQCGLFARRES